MNMAPTLSIVIVRNPYLDFRHLQFLLASLNQQSCSDFNTFWLDQTADPDSLRDLLQTQAQFAYEIDHDPPQQVAGVPCWDLTRPFTRFMEHPAFGEAFTYLHMECLPEQNFVEGLLSLWPALSQKYGHYFIAILEQLRTLLDIRSLNLEANLFWQQLRLSNLETWVKKDDSTYSLPSETCSQWQPCNKWSENAFLMPSALARETSLFSAPERPLYFQDIFDIFNYLQDRPYWQHIQWVKLPQAIIYHLAHHRAFEEYSEPFLKEIINHPDLFKGFFIYDLDWGNTLADIRQRLNQRQQLNQEHTPPFVILRLFRDCEKGTLGYWLKAMDRLHNYHHPTPFALYWEQSCLPPSR